MAFSTTPSVGNDRLRATDIFQTINALGGNDWIRSTFNGSTLYGGLGHDRISVFLEMLEPTQLTNTGTASLFGGNGNDTLVTDLIGHATLDQGFAFSVEQSGGRGNDNLYVNATSTSENTQVSLGAFNFNLSGGTGDDAIWIESDGVAGGANSVVDAGSGSDIVYIFADGNFFGGPSSNEVLAGAGDDDVTAQAYGDFFGGDGKNVINGGDGNDRIEATVRGVGGSNEIFGEEGDDILIADGSVYNDSGSFMTNIARGGAGNDTILVDGAASGATTGVTNEAYGDDGDDEITSITYFSGDPNTETSGTADARLYGGTGNDTITATTGYEVGSEEFGGATLYGGDGNDILRVNSGVENVLNGGAGDDTITGGSGNDRIIGGSGADTLRSGGGEDAFVYLWTTGIDLATRDTIRGFGFGDDVIDLSAIDANANQRGNQTFTFGGGTGVGRAWVEDNATGTGSVIRANTGGAEQLYINVEDGTGRDASDWTADDFLL